MLLSLIASTTRFGLQHRHRGALLWAVVHALLESGLEEGDGSVSSPVALLLARPLEGGETAAARAPKLEEPKAEAVRPARVSRTSSQARPELEEGFEPKTGFELRAPGAKRK